MEGSPAMKSLNYGVPGFNAISNLHDIWVTAMGWTKSDLLFWLSMPVAAAVTYGALLTGPGATAASINHDYGR